MLNISIISKHLISRVLLLTAIVALTTSFKHPIKASASLIEYDDQSNKIKIECRVFIDDFEKSINKTLPKNLNLTHLTKEDVAGINAYFNDYFGISLNDKPLLIKYKACEVLKEYNMLIVKFEDNTIKLKIGDKLKLFNTLFFADFGYIQTNRITIRMPPFFRESNVEATMDNYEFPFTIKNYNK